MISEKPCGLQHFLVYYYVRLYGFTVLHFACACQFVFWVFPLLMRFVSSPIHSQRSCRRCRTLRWVSAPTPMQTPRSTAPPSLVPHPLFPTRSQASVARWTLNAHLSNAILISKDHKIRIWCLYLSFFFCIRSPASVARWTLKSPPIHPYDLHFCSKIPVKPVVWWLSHLHV